MIVQTVIFKRKKTSKTEVGIVINDDSVIIDRSGEIVKKPIWNFKTVTGIKVDLLPILESLEEVEFKW